MWLRIKWVSLDSKSASARLNCHNSDICHWLLRWPLAIHTGPDHSSDVFTANLREQLFSLQKPSLAACCTAKCCFVHTFCGSALGNALCLHGEQKNLELLKYSASQPSEGQRWSQWHFFNVFIKEQNSRRVEGTASSLQYLAELDPVLQPTFKKC